MSERPTTLFQDALAEIARLRTRLGDMEQNADRQTEILDQVSAQLAELTGRSRETIEQLESEVHTAWASYADQKEKLAEAQREVERLTWLVEQTGKELLSGYKIYEAMK